MFLTPLFSIWNTKTDHASQTNALVAKQSCRDERENRACCSSNNSVPWVLGVVHYFITVSGHIKMRAASAICFPNIRRSCGTRFKVVVINYMEEASNFNAARLFTEVQHLVLEKIFLNDESKLGHRMWLINTDTPKNFIDTLKKWNVVKHLLYEPY